MMIFVCTFNNLMFTGESNSCAGPLPPLALWLSSLQKGIPKASEN